MIDDIDPYIKDLHGYFTDLGEAEHIPPNWIVKDLLPPGLVFIGGPPKSQKSTIEMAIALLVSGLPCPALPPFLSEVANPGTVIGFSYEATAGELRHMCEAGLRTLVPNDKRILISDDPWLFRLDDPDGPDKLLYWLEDRKPRLCFLDPLRDFHSLKEEDSGGMNRMLRPLQRWAKENDSCVLIVHHTKKKDEENGPYNPHDLRGSSALFAIADGVLMATPKGPEGSGLINIHATFKRAAGWERTIRFASYGVTETGEVLGDIEKQVLSLLKGGAPNLEDVAKQLRCNKARVVKAVEMLVRNHYLVREKRSLKPTDKIV